MPVAKSKRDKRSSNRVAEMVGGWGFLKDIGALGHINRSILHQIGISIGVDRQGNPVVLDARETPEALVIPSADIKAYRDRWKTYISEKGNLAIKRRRKELGYHVQPIPEE